MEFRLSQAKFAPAAGVAACLALIFLRANEFGQRFLGLTPLQSRDLFWWPLLGVLVFYVACIEKRPLSSIGFKAPTWKTLASGALTAGLWILVLAPSVTFLVSHLPSLPAPPSAGAQSIQNSPFWYRALVILRASIGEEVVFRGFIIGRICEITGSRGLAVAISLVAFTFAHLSFWGVAPLFAVAAAGLLLSILYLWRGDLIANILAHYIMDGAVLLI